MATSNRVVGTPVGRTEGPEKTTGSAKYGEDATLPGMLWARVLRSPSPHARIVSVDTSAAEAVPGVHAVITGADLEGVRTGGQWKDEPILVWDRVRFVGDPVAAVAADDEDIADHALGLVQIEYEELPQVFSVEEAIRPGAEIIHPDFNAYRGVEQMETPSNRFATVAHTNGDLAAGFAEADLIVEGTYGTQRSHQGYLEPHSSLVSIGRDGAVDAWESTQMPLMARNELARVSEKDREQIVINPAYVGGSFGGKINAPGTLLCYFLAQRTGRPVKYVLDYSEELLAGNPRHPCSIRIKTGVKFDGTITALEAEGYFTTGAYAANAPVAPFGFRSANELAGPYVIPNVSITHHQVYTNEIPCGIMRSPGEFQGIFVGESHVDVVARRLGMDPLDFRLKNLVHEGDAMPDGAMYKDLRVEEALRTAAEASGYHKTKSANVGRGVAVGHRTTFGNDAYVTVAVDPDGRIEARHPVFDPGTGTATVIAQVVAEELGVSPEAVVVTQIGTDKGKFDFGAGGSRGARVYSVAAYEGTRELKSKLSRLAAEFLGWAEEEIEFRDGDIINRSGDRVSLREIASRSGSEVSADGESAESRGSPWTSFGAHVVEVEVDRETGVFQIRRYVAVHETGEMLNPIGYHGQIDGGIVYALGQALTEDLVVEEGRVTNPSLADFKLMNINDIPPLEKIVLESDLGHGPYKVRGVGEHSNLMPAPAVANAIHDAVGVRIPTLPITAEKVYQQLRAID